MKLPGIGRLPHIGRSISNLFAPRAIILLYHRVTELSSDPQLLCVSRRHFAEHLEVIRKLSCPTPLRAVGSARPRRSTRRCRVIVTFDDGYADNLYNARALLERYEVPATVFVATAYIGSEREFWQDELEKIFLQPGTLPELFRMRINGISYEQELGEVARYREDAYERHCGWNISRRDNPTVRHKLYRFLVTLLQHLPEKQPQEILTGLLLWARLEPASRRSHRTLSQAELLELADGGLVEIGSHTVNHPMLSMLPITAQRDEIAQSKARLEEILGKRIDSFAYPYGGRSDYDSDAVTAVREAGFTRACANYGGPLHSDTDVWQLPRFLVRNWNGDEFGHRLREWLSE